MLRGVSVSLEVPDVTTDLAQIPLRMAQLGQDIKAMAGLSRSILAGW